METLATERHSANADTPVFMAHGSHDPVVRVERGSASRDALLALGQPVQWHSYPMEHSLCQAEVADISAFFQRVLRA
jgi:phospholipase/carboxylesterase